jgi:hypothetical protein
MAEPESTGTNSVKTNDEEKMINRGIAVELDKILADPQRQANIKRIEKVLFGTVSTTKSATSGRNAGQAGAAS